MTVRTKHAAGTLCWLDLMTADSEGSREFYAALFGWTFQVKGSGSGAYAVAYAGQHPVAAVVPPLEGPSAWCVYFASEDVDADAGRIRELGGQVKVGPLQVGTQGRLLMATDPTGAVFGLWQSGGGLGLTGTPGTPAWAELQTRDADRARDFYTALLHNTSQKVPEMDYHTLYHGEDQNVGVMQMDDVHWPPELPSHWMISFSVANTDEALRVAQANGGRLLSAPHDSPYGRLAALQDPGGAAFSVIQLP